MISRQGAPKKPIRVGVVGAGRGMTFAHPAPVIGMELVALCDTWEQKLRQAGSDLGVTTYTDFRKFITHEMDAVILANYCHEHAPLAIEAMRAGMHVMSECMPNKTMAEGVELCRTVEQTGRIYMLAENYPYSSANQELRRLYRAGEIGEVRYAEGEYNHPGPEDWRLSISPGPDHWRNWLTPTYYCTHALAPLMYITNTMPVSVNALSIVEQPTQSPNTMKIADAGSVILTRMNNGAVCRLFGLMLSSIERVRYEVHGERGLLSTAEPDHWGTVRVHHEPWLGKTGKLKNIVYSAEWPSHAEEAQRSSHGGGDFWTCFHFANAIRSGKQPYLNVYRAAAMSAVSILAWRSCLEEGRPFHIPDFKKVSQRRKFQDDHWSPFPGDVCPDKPPVSIRGNIKPSRAAVNHARKVWKSIGYEQ